MGVEQGDDLTDGHAQSIVPMSAENQQSVADGGSRKGVGNRRFDHFLTARTITAIDGMLGDDRLNFFGDIFNDARSLGFVPLLGLELVAAGWAYLQAMLFAVVDPGRLGAMMAGVALLLSWFFPFFEDGRFGIDWFLTGWRRRRRRFLQPCPTDEFEHDNQGG